MSSEEGNTSGSRLFLIDGTALVYRSYFAFQSSLLTDSSGRNISAVYGFFNTLFSIIEREKPEHLVIAFDTKAPTFRHQVYPDYKATRQKMPEDLSEQLPILRDALETSGIALMEKEGFEADDLIGTAAKIAENAGLDVIIVTGDKDFFQLVSDKVKVYNLRTSTSDPEILGASEVVEKFGVPPEKVIEVLGLMGDSSDNIPGVRGIGPKTAVRLVNDFGSISSVYSHLDEVKASDRKKLEGNEDTALFSRQLVIIKTDCPVSADLEAWRMRLNDDSLREKFTELEFSSLLKYLKESEAAPEELKREYYIIDTPEKLADLLRKLQKAEIFAFDTETTSESPMNAELVGLSFSFTEGEAYYIPCNGFRLPPGAEIPRTFKWFGEEVNPTTAYILSSLQPILEDSAIPKLAQNAKYDMLVLKNYGIEVQGLTFDTMVAHYLLDPGARGHGLDALSMKYLRLKKIPTSDLIGSGAKQITMDIVPIEKVTEYACEDADCAYRLMNMLKANLEEENLQWLFSEVEIPLIPVLLTLERNGVALDTRLLGEMSGELEQLLREIEGDIHRLAGREFNINSPKQLGYILFEELNLPVIRKTKTGYSTDESVLKKLSAQDPLPAEILRYRSLAKLKNTYTDALPQLINPRTGRVHTSYNQTVTATGRLSSSDPNLQNIPVRTGIGGRIRAAFIPEKPGWKILSADYSQIELRVLAHLSEDLQLIESFRDDEDIHRRTGSMIFNSPLELVTPEMRRAAKEVNFGVIYGMRDFGLSERLGIPRKRAREFIESYFSSYPQVFQFVEMTIETVRNTGYTETIFGRKRRLPEINSKNHNIRSNAERIAVNTPIQGSAADMIKLAMIRIHRRMKSEKVESLMIMQVHDELVFEVPEGEVELMVKLVVEEMESAMPLSVPIRVDVSYGENWLEAH
ncbi:MAG: DNA polymerase I [candidate division Zixibacteria bacterium]|nr:DNA polymerase I [Candidatus Tariuqbacter arcticus]